MVSILAALTVSWLILAGTLWTLGPDKTRLQDLARLQPDVLRLLKRLAVDPQLPRRIRVGSFLVLAFVLSPIDVIPDVIPVIGFADDVIIVALVLRWVARAGGQAALVTHWPGTPDGLAALCRLCGIPDPAGEDSPA